MIEASKVQAINFRKLTRSMLAPKISFSKPICCKHNKTSLVDCEKKYRLLFNSIDQGFFLIDVIFSEDHLPVDMLFVEANAAATAMFGQDLTGKYLSKVYPNFDSVFFQKYVDVASTGESIRFQRYYAQIKMWVEFYVFKVGDNRTNRVGAIFHNITDRKRQEMNADFLAKVGECCSRLSSPQEFMAAVGKQLYKHLGLTFLTFSFVDESTLTLNTVYDLHEPHQAGMRGTHYLPYHIDDNCITDLKSGRIVAITDVTTDLRTAAKAPVYMRADRHAIVLVPYVTEGKWTFLVGAFKNQPYHWQEDELKLLQELAMHFFLRLERARAEEAALAAKEATLERERLEAILEAIPSAIALISAADTKCSYINKRSIALHGFNYLGLDLDTFFSKVNVFKPDGTIYRTEDLATTRLLKTGEAVRREEVLIKRPDGTGFPALVSTAPLYDAQGKISFAVVAIEDISERKWLENELLQHRKNLAKIVEDQLQHIRRSERHYRTLVNNAPLMFSIFDKEYRYKYRTFRPEDYLGHKSEHIVGKTWAELGVPESLWHKWQDKFDEAVTTKRTVIFETKIMQANDEAIDILVHVVPELDEQGQVESLLTFSLNITERNKLESELLRLDRLNTVGEMAAAIGHEVRNPLTTVRGYLQMLQRKDENRHYSQQFSIMIEELDRANTIISDFLSLAKNKAIELKSYNLNDILKTLQPLLQAEALRTGHELKIDMNDIPNARIDEKEIRQLLLNLSRNAFEAMDPGGGLTITTVARNSYIELSVRDTGKGIPQAVLEKLGTPFLTTKENGTGLGLAVCYRIADRHGAKIAVNTSPQGTVFTVNFPYMQQTLF